ncbi:lipopolysaccharide biosynthesis protein [Sphingomonas sp. AP4-R1]|nr:lipopolysaccharide biosynthesis protein [Sphingomonas sp. AP4-R1]
MVSAYYSLIAANQYESEAHFLVRTANASPQQQSPGLGAALGMLGAGVSIGSSDASSVSDYLSSHDAVGALKQRYGLIEKFRRPEADLLSRLNPANPSPERLLKFYRGQVDVLQNPETGITSIRVRGFRPQDSYDLVNALLELGEQRVNVLNRRAYESSVQVARRNLASAEQMVRQTQSATTAFRQRRRSIDPIATGQAQIELVKQLQGNLAQARAARSAMTGSVQPSSPQFRAVESRVRALEGQVATESARLSGGANAIAANVGDYQGLLLRQQFASKRYDDAAATLQRASEQASKQQLFVVRIVEPNMPVRALFPKSGKIVFTVFVVLVLLYSLGWLIVAGVREHSA